MSVCTCGVMHGFGSKLCKHRWTVWSVSGKAPFFIDKEEDLNPEASRFRHGTDLDTDTAIKMVTVFEKIGRAF